VIQQWRGGVKSVVFVGEQLHQQTAVAAAASSRQPTTAPGVLSFTRVSIQVMTYLVGRFFQRSL